MSNEEIVLEGIEEDFFAAKSAGYMLSAAFICGIYDIEDSAERERVIALSKVKAKEKEIDREFVQAIKAYENKFLKYERAYADNKFTEFTFSLITLNCGFWIANDKGIFRTNKDGDYICVSRVPVLPVALLKNIDSGNEKIKLEFFKGKKLSLICDRQITASSTKIVQLADKGIEVTTENAKDLVKYISDCVTNNLDVLPQYKSCSRLGWNYYGFSPYSADIIFDGEDENRPLFLSVREQGDFETWKRLMYVLRKNLLIRLIMAASFASVLIKKINALPFVFHLWGGTGTGKTVALMIAASIWGSPTLGTFIRSLNSTLNSMLATAAFLNNLPFLGDELQTVKQNTWNYDRLIMQLCEGVDRGRMDSNSKQKELKKWSCSFIFTGEEPCTKSNSGGGVKNRVIEAEVSEPLFGIGQGNEVVNLISENFGHAGKAFVDYVAKQEKKDLSSQLAYYSQMLQQQCQTTEKQASSMALIMIADKLACECIFEEESPLTAEQCSQFVVPAIEVDTAERAYRCLIGIISVNKNRFADNDYGEIWGQHYANSKYVLFEKDKLKQCLCEYGFEFDAVKKKWAEKGYIQKNKQGRFFFSTTCHGLQGRYVRIVLPIQEHDEFPLDEFDEEKNNPFFE